ncbi:probable lipid phosphate phosphatase beta isoform X3 [Typha angustifolia]|uniref:probable lipid phosphate phosphatase beta isoform X3 n=1 Tax=Typha angustifolia TaxID=59011 RepID=UPI003C2C65A8
MATTTKSLLQRLIDLDTAVSLRIHSSFVCIPRLLLKTLEISGDGRLWFPISLSLFPFSSSSSTTSFSLLFSLLLGLLLDILIIGLIKHLVRRPRPVYNKGMSLTFAVDHWSFPSGHSSRVFFIASFLYLCYDSVQRWIGEYWAGGGGNRLEKMVVPAVFVWSAATSASRVLLGRHFVLDVIAGAGLGVIEALITFRFVRLLAGWESHAGRMVHS